MSEWITREDLEERQRGHSHAIEKDFGDNRAHEVSCKQDFLGAGMDSSIKWDNQRKGEGGNWMDKESKEDVPAGLRFPVK